QKELAVENAPVDLAEPKEEDARSERANGIDPRANRQRDAVLERAKMRGVAVAAAWNGERPVREIRSVQQRQSLVPEVELVLRPPRDHVFDRPSRFSQRTPAEKARVGIEGM